MVEDYTSRTQSLILRSLTIVKKLKTKLKLTSQSHKHLMYQQGMVDSSVMEIDDLAKLKWIPVNTNINALL